MLQVACFFRSFIELFSPKRIDVISNLDVMVAEYGRWARRQVHVCRIVLAARNLHVTGALGLANFGRQVTLDHKPKPTVRAAIG